MAHQINSSCTNCGACIGVCPTKSIVAGPKMHLIDTDTCDDWGACVAVCPVRAIESVPQKNKAGTPANPTSRAKGK